MLNRKILLVIFSLFIIIGFFVAGLYLGASYPSYFLPYLPFSQNVQKYTFGLASKYNPYIFMQYLMYKGILTEFSDEKIVLVENDVKPRIILLTPELNKIITYSKKAANSPMPVAVNKSDFVPNSQVTITVSVDLLRNRISEINLRID